MGISETLEFFFPVKINSGKKALAHTPYEIKGLNAKSPLVITTKTADKKKQIKNLIYAFKDSGINLGIYDKISDDSDIGTIEELAGIFKDNGFDSIISLGSKTISNIAKILNIAVSKNNGNLNNFKGYDKIDYPLKPMIIIAESPKTGDAVSNRAALGDMFFVSEYLFPDLVVIDPEIIKKEDTKTIIDTAMTTLACCLESFRKESSSNIANACAHTGISLVMDNIIPLINESLSLKNRYNIFDKKNINSHTALTNASVMGECIVSNSKNLLSLKLGTEAARHCNSSEGICMGIILPYVLEFLSIKKEINLSRLLLPLSGIDIFCRTPEYQRFDMAVAKIRDLQNEIFMISGAKVPRTLKEADMPQNSIDEIVKAVCSDHYNNYNEDECLFILKHAFEGKPLK